MTLNLILVCCIFSNNLSKLLFILFDCTNTVKCYSI